jgi:hypothetical protein
MIRYSNRFKAGTRKNKKWAKSNGPDRHKGLAKDVLQSVIDSLHSQGFSYFPLQGIPDGAYGNKPNHAARVLNVDWKALKEARIAEEIIQAAIFESKNVQS